MVTASLTERMIPGCRSSEHCPSLHNGQLLSQGEVLESELALRIQARSGGRRGFEEGQGRISWDQLRGSYQIGEVQARSWMVLG